jgi:rubrerythrin
LIQIIKIAKIDAIILDVDIKRDRFEILHKMYQGRTENSLLLINPSVAELWDYNKNNPLLPSEVTSKSSLRVHWKCPICQYEWETAISNQMTSRGCPQCNNSVVSDQYNFAFLYPELLEEWDYTANDILPNALMPFSHEKRGWVCKVCGHKWQSSTAHRIDGNGCPECAKEKSRLAILKPVSQFSKDKRELMAQYESARAAERATNIGYKQISACCCGTKPSAGGYWWCFSMDIK